MTPEPTTAPIRRAARSREIATARRRGGLSYRTRLVLMLTPYLLGLLILTAIPAIIGLPLAFTTFNAIEPPTWRGLGNFSEMLGDHIFWTAVRNSLLFVALATPLRIAGALLLALLLLRPRRGVGLYRAASYLPTVVPDIAWAVVWLWVLNPIYGPLNQLLGLAGLPGPGWMVNEWPTRFAIVLMLSWQLGEGFVVCLAALQDVPRELHEQGAVDGGTGWSSFWGITLPLMIPVLLVLIFRDTIHGLQSNFTAALIVGRGGGPNFATTYLPLYIYREAFDYLRFGYAAAITWALWAITGIVLYLQYRVVVRWKMGFGDAE